MSKKSFNSNLTAFYLIYKITNKVNGKVYIGAHKTNNKNDSYMGSGDLIKLALKKYGKRNFVKEILFELDSEKEMYKKEREIVQLGKNFYNLINGGGFPLVFTDEIRQKIGKASSINQLGERNSQYGKIWINNGLTNIKVFKTDIFPDGYQKGRVVDKTKLHKIPKGKDSYNIGKHFINNGKDNLFVKAEDPILEGYVKGRLINYPNNNKYPCQKGNKNSQYGNKWITNGKDNFIIKSHENFPVGFKLGRTMCTNWIWITDGLKNKKLNSDEKIPEGFYKGKIRIKELKEI